MPTAYPYVIGQITAEKANQIYSELNYPWLISSTGPAFIVIPRGLETLKCEN